MRTDLYAAVIPKFFGRLLIKRSLIIHGTGKQTRDFTYVEDTCNGIMLADQTRNAIGDTFNIGQGREVSIKTIAKTMIKEYHEITGKNVNEDLFFVAQRKGDVMRHLADISHARKILGYKPVIPIKEGIKKYILWSIDNSR